MTQIIRLILLLICLHGLLACSGPTLARSALPPAPVAVEPAGFPNEALGAALLVADCKNYGHCPMRPVNPLTGQDIPGYEPFEWDQFSSFTFSPDRTRLAITLFSPNAMSGKLHLIDVPAWQDVTTQVTVSGWTLNNIMAFSPDGTRLALTTETHEDRSRLAVMDVASQKVTASLPLNFVPWVLAFTPDGAGLVVYGSTHTSGADPQVALFNAADLSLLWGQALPEVRDGDYPLPGGTGPRDNESLRPARVLSPDRRYLYLVHADEEQLTKVDFVDQSVTTTAVMEAYGWFERFLAFTAGTAQAKSTDGAVKQAVISPDGSRLYIVGQTYHKVQGEDGFDSAYSSLGGLQVIDPATGTELGWVEGETTSVGISPDGQQLYLWEEIQADPERIPRLTVLDATTLTELKSLEGWTLWSTNRLDGQQVLVGYNFQQPEGFKTTGFDSQTLEVLQPFTGSILDTRQ